jgi:hypothetical protein
MPITQFKNQGNAIVVKPLKEKSEQEYFYTTQWQIGEKNADEDIKKGSLTGPLDNIKDALNALKNTKV